MKLRVLVLGGTRFIGRTIVEELASAGHEAVVFHRGQTEPADEPGGSTGVPHIHGDRRALTEGSVPDEIRAFGPDAIIDCAAIGAPDTDAVLGGLGVVLGGELERARLVVLSSMDTYRAYAGLHREMATDPLPLTEESAVRDGDDRYPYRGQIEGMDDYEKLDVEARWLARGGTVLRLPMTYGPRDYQRREEFILRRVRAGRKQIPIGAANALLTHGFVGDVARAARLVMEADTGVVGGEVFNLGERSTPTVELRARWILEAAGVADRTELVRVADEHLPADLGLTAAMRQHLLVDSTKANRLLGWTQDDPMRTLRRSVEWHLEHPPEASPGEDDVDGSFAADDAALATA